MRSPATKVAAAALVAAALACNVREPDATTNGDSAAASMAAAATAALPAAELERLAARYPVLRAEPAPEPQPGATVRPPPAALRSLPGDVLRRITGEATYYADSFEGRRTASGIPFRQNQMVAAHRAYPFGTLLRVTNLRNDRTVQVRVVDRGPWGAKAAARNTIIDLSRRAADQLGYTRAGRTPVKVEVLEWGGPLASAE